MCLKLKDGEDVSNILKAKTDIYCYKMVIVKTNEVNKSYLFGLYTKKLIVETYRTLYKDFEIKLGSTYFSKLCVEWYMDVFNGEYGNKVEEGLHSYEDYEDCQKKASYFKGRYPHDNVVVVECVIPRHSKYYVGTFDGCVSYASDCLRYIKIVTN